MLIPNSLWTNDWHISLKFYRPVLHRSSRHLNVIKRHRVISEFLIIFVPFAGD
jgi:hypothetical protein